MNDVKANILHTKEGLKRREEKGVIMSEGNFVRLLNAFMLFADYADKSLPLLDVGTREGWFLEFMQRAGFKDVQAIEVCPEAVAFARSKGLKVTKLDVQKMKFQDEFGTITAIHVLEHCSNPKQAMNNIYKALKEDGILYLEVPLEDDFNSARSGHFSAFPNEKDLFSLLDGKKWERLEESVIVMNKARTKRNLRTVWKRK